MKKILVRVYFVLLLLCFISLIVLSILGSKSRVGYLEIFYFNENDSYKNHYIYEFKIECYDKVFKNNDIYDIHIFTNSIPHYIIDIKFKREGGPFGTLISLQQIEKLDNIRYTLSIRNYLIYCIPVLILLPFLIIAFKYSFLFFIIYIILMSIPIEYLYIIIVILSIFCIIVSGKLKYFNIFLFKDIKIQYISTFFIFILIFCFIYNILFLSNSFLDFTSNNENRNLASLPNISLHNINIYPKEYEEYFNDHLPFRNELIKLKNIIDVFIFQNPIDKSIVVGKKKWLFSKLGGYKFFTDEELEVAKKNLINLRDELSKRNIDFVFMIFPIKQSIYLEYAPDYIIKESIKNSEAADMFVNYMRNNTDITIIYPKYDLLKYKNKYQLFYKYDTHWNNISGYIAYMNLMRNLNLKYTDIDNLDIVKYYSKDKFSNDFYNNLAMNIGLGNIKYYNDDYIYRINNFTNYVLLEGVNMANYSKSTMSLYSSNNINLFVASDSFFHTMFNYVASSFDNVYFRYINDFNINEINIKKPDIFILETLEPNLKGKILYDITNYKIIDKDLYY